MWNDWDGIEAAQRIADAQAEERQAERVARPEARQRGDIIAAAEQVAASEVDRLAAHAREQLRVVTDWAPEAPAAPEPVLDARSAPDPLRALRVYIAKMRRAIDTETNEP